MLGHRTPWSAVQSVIDVSRTAARAVHSLGLARPSAFSSTAAQTTHNRETTSSNFTVNHTCASIAINSTATDVDECASKCLNYYFADKGMSPDDIFVDEEVSNMTQMLCVPFPHMHPVHPQHSETFHKVQHRAPR